MTNSTQTTMIYAEHSGDGLREITTGTPLRQILPGGYSRHEATDCGAMKVVRYRNDVGESIVVVVARRRVAA